MADLVINPEYKDQVMSHGDIRAKSLENHTQDELLSLAIQARTSGNPVLLRCFIDLLELSELRSIKVAGEVAKVSPEVAKVTAAPAIKKLIPATPSKEESELLASIQP